MPPVLGVVWGQGSASPSEIGTAAAGLCDLVYLADLADPEVGRVEPMMRAFGRVLDVPGNCSRAALDATADERLDGVVTFTDSLLDLTRAIASFRDLPGHDGATTRRLTSKLEQRIRLNEAGVGRVATCAVLADAKEPPDGSPPPPGVLKPDLGTSSADTFVVADEASLAVALAERRPGVPYVFEALIPPGAHPGAGWLADYVSVETAVSGETIHHLGISDKLPLAPPARETGMIFPSALPGACLDEVLDFASRAITATGITSGLVHTEIKLSAAGLQIVEVNGRLGGDVERLCRRVSNQRPVRLALELALGHDLTVERPTYTGVAMNYSVQPPVAATRVLEIPEDATWRSLHGVFAVHRRAKRGEMMSWRRGSIGSAIDIWIEGSDHSELHSRLDAVRAVERDGVRWDATSALVSLP